MALFLSLGGISWAAANLPKNSVGSKQIKKNAVTNAKIKKNAVTSSKIKKGAISSSKIKAGSILGSNINLGSLGKVPAAANADAVGSDLGPLSKQVTSSASGANQDAARALATEVPLASSGQVTLYAKCYVDTSSNTLYGEVLMRTAADGALALSTNDSYYGDTEFLNAATPENARTAWYAGTGNNSADYSSDSIGTVIGPDGSGLQYHGMVWVKHGTVAGSSPLNNAADICRFTLDGKRF